MDLTKLYAIPDGDLALGIESEERTYVLRLRDLPAEERPREKLAKFGPESLQLAELLAVVFEIGTRKEEVLRMSRRIFKEYGETAISGGRDPRALAENLDIPLTKAMQLVACLEIGRRLYGKSIGKRALLRTARQVSVHVRDMHGLAKEHLRGIYLDAHYRVLHEEVLSIGSVTANIIHPREVFQPAIERGASALILVHNHPSGDTAPSKSDLEITQQIIEAGKLMGIALLDHVIVGKGKFTSIPAKYVI